MRGGMDGPALRPWEIRKLTLPEIMTYLDNEDGSRPEGIPIISHAQHLELIERRRRMTLQERLEEARADVR